MAIPDELINLLNQVIDESTRRQSSGDETFLQCLLCDEWEGHKDNCPIPAINKWLETDDSTATT